MNDTKLKNVTHKICSICEENKTIDNYYNRTSICRMCFNIKRREKYHNDEEHRKKNNSTS